ncbi:MAG: 2OG-Fe dioxygenase family protein [bacterium]|nr:2OG-Fe dioxygenase family protein [bacterium]
MNKDHATHVASLGNRASSQPPRGTLQGVEHDRGRNPVLTDGVFEDTHPRFTGALALAGSDEIDLQVATNHDPDRALRESGFVVLQGEDFIVPAALTEPLDTFALAYDHLPQDRYSEAGCRFRRHQRLVLIPRPLTVIPTDVSNYAQSMLLNSEEGGAVREFEPLPDDLATNSFLQALIRFDFDHSPFASVRSGNLAYDVGLHLIRTRARPGRPAVASPNKLHKDGEWVTWIHLVSRQGIRGGESVVADNDKQILMRATLAQRLDTVAVWDESVFHHVDPVEVAEGEDEGYRDVLLIDFTPMLSATSYQDASERLMSGFRTHFSDVP